MSPGFSFFSKHREADFEALACLQYLGEFGDPDAAVRRVAEASARMLPAGEQLAGNYREEPDRYFAIQEARSGTVDGVEVLLVWTEPHASPAMTGGVDASTGSRTGTTFAFAELPVQVPTASLYPRPRSVPVSAGGGIGDPELDARFLTAAEDPFRSLPGRVRSTLLATPPRSIAWFVIWGSNACAHSVEPPGANGKGDDLISLVSSASRAFR